MTLTFHNKFGPRLTSLDTMRPAGRKLKTNILTAGATVLRSTVREHVPGRYNRIRRAVTSTIDRRSGDISARVGINIADKRGVAPEARWIINGTKLRATKNGANRGRMRGDDFFSRAIRRGTSGTLQAIRTTLATETRNP